MQQRIYIVTDKVTGASRLVEASLPAQAVRHVANEIFSVKVATTYEVADLVSEGRSIERTKGE